jgi:CheY-like chemotaxis protein
VSVLDVDGEDAALALLGDIGIAPDVVLADYQLDGGRNGLDAIAALRARHGDLPACLVTADRSPEVAARCKALDIPVINKPVSPARLRAVLGAIAGRTAPLPA